MPQTNLTRRQRILSAAIGPTLLYLAWPLVVSLQLTNFVLLLQTLWIGRLVGTDGLAVLAIMAPLEFLLVWLISSISQGLGTLVTDSVGANDGKALRLVVSAVVLTLLVTGALGVVGIAISKPLAHQLANGNAALEPQLHWYVVLFILALPALGTLDVLLEAVASAGWTQFEISRVLADLALTGALMPALIKLTRLGVAAAPTAMMFGGLVFATLLWFSVYQRRVALHFGDTVRSGPIFDVQLWRQFVAIGAPAQLGRVAGFIAQILLVRLVLREGKVIAAGYGLCMTVMLILPMFTMGIGRACAIVIGQNRGANQPRRAVSSLKWSIGFNVIISIVVTMLVPYSRSLLVLFSADPAVVDAALGAIRVMRWGFLCIPIWQLLVFSYTVCGTATPAGLAMIASQVVGVVVAYSLKRPPVESAGWGFAAGHACTFLSTVALLPHAFLKPLLNPRATPPTSRDAMDCPEPVAFTPSVNPEKSD